MPSLTNRTEICVINTLSAYESYIDRSNTTLKCDEVKYPRLNITAPGIEGNGACLQEKSNIRNHYEIIDYKYTITKQLLGYVALNYSDYDCYKWSNQGVIDYNMDGEVKNKDSFIFVLKNLTNNKEFIKNKFLSIRSSILPSRNLFQ